MPKKQNDNTSSGEPDDDKKTPSEGEACDFRPESPSAPLQAQPKDDKAAAEKLTRKMAEALPRKDIKAPDIKMSDMKKSDIKIAGSIPIKMDPKAGQPKMPDAIKPLPSAPRPARNLVPQTPSERVAAGELMTYTRPKWKHATRVFGVLILLLLNFSMVMSDIERHSKHMQLDFGKEALTYLVLLFFDITILLPLIFEVNQVDVNSEQLILKTIFFAAKLKWADIVYFKKPLYLKFGIVRTRRCIYLINKKDIKNFDDLAETIMARTHVIES